MYFINEIIKRLDKLEDKSEGYPLVILKYLKFGHKELRDAFIKFGISNSTEMITLNQILGVIKSEIESPSITDLQIEEMGNILITEVPLAKTDVYVIIENYKPIAHLYITTYSSWLYSIDMVVSTGIEFDNLSHYEIINHKLSDKLTDEELAEEMLIKLNLPFSMIELKKISD